MPYCVMDLGDVYDECDGSHVTLPINEGTDSGDSQSHSFFNNLFCYQSMKMDLLGFVLSHDGS